jgi:hypothetical protein
MTDSSLVFSTDTQKCLFLGLKRPASRLGSDSAGSKRL